jgi:hypothetical protein
MTKTQTQTETSLLAQQVKLDQVDLSKNILPKGYFETIKEALEALKAHCPKGAVVVLIDFPEGNVNQELNNLKNQYVIGKSSWAIKNANGEIISHDDKPFANCSGVIIRGYNALSGGPQREMTWQNTLIRKLAGNPVFILTNAWPDREIFSKGLAFSKDVFTRGAEVMALRFDSEHNAIQIGHGALKQVNGTGPLEYAFRKIR